MDIDGRTRPRVAVESVVSSGPFSLVKPNVPIVGQPFKLLQHYHTYVVQCGCEAGTVAVIIGDGQGVPCPACGGVPAARISGEVSLGFGRPQAALVQ